MVAHFFSDDEAVRGNTADPDLIAALDEKRTALKSAYEAWNNTAARIKKEHPSIVAYQQKLEAALLKAALDSQNALRNISANRSDIAMRMNEAFTIMDTAEVGNASVVNNQPDAETRARDARRLVLMVDGLGVKTTAVSGRINTDFSNAHIQEAKTRAAGLEKAVQKANGGPLRNILDAELGAKRAYREGPLKFPLGRVGSWQKFMSAINEFGIDNLDLGRTPKEAVGIAEKAFQMAVDERMGTLNPEETKLRSQRVPEFEARKKEFFAEIKKMLPVPSNKEWRPALRDAIDRVNFLLAFYDISASVRKDPALALVDTLSAAKYMSAPLVAVSVQSDGTQIPAGSENLSALTMPARSRLLGEREGAINSWLQENIRHVAVGNLSAALRTLFGKDLERHVSAINEMLEGVAEVNGFSGNNEDSNIFYNQSVSAILSAIYNGTIRDDDSFDQFLLRMRTALTIPTMEGSADGFETTADRLEAFRNL